MNMNNPRTVGAPDRPHLLNNPDGIDNNDGIRGQGFNLPR
jgi:hypothetical protein